MFIRLVKYSSFIKTIHLIPSIYYKESNRWNEVLKLFERFYGEYSTEPI